MSDVNIFDGHSDLSYPTQDMFKVKFPDSKNFEIWLIFSNVSEGDNDFTLSFKRPLVNGGLAESGSSIRFVPREGLRLTGYTFSIPYIADEVLCTGDGDFDVIINMYSTDSAVKVEAGNGLEYGSVTRSVTRSVSDDSSVLNVNASNIHDDNLATSSKYVTGGINELFQSSISAYNTFASTITSKGGTVEKSGAHYTKTEINNGILSISGGGGGNIAGSQYIMVEPIMIVSYTLPEEVTIPDNLNLQNDNIGGETLGTI